MASEIKVDTISEKTSAGGVTIDGVLLKDTQLDIGDSKKLLLGAGDDLTLYHDGSNSYITNSTGALKVATETSGIAITIGHTTSEITVADNLTITGTTVGTSFDLNGTADGLILDADADTTISSPTDDQIDIEISGADDFKFTANTFTALAGSDVVSANYGTYRNRLNARPLLYNANMAISQRSTSVTGITNGSSGYHTVDRWNWSEVGAPTVVHTMTQEALTADEAFEDGFATAVKLDVTTADASLAAADYIILEQKLEGFDVQLIKKGSSTAEILTLAFWVKSTKTGTLIAELFDTDNSRTCSTAYTISSTNTWEFKVLNFPADTSGAFGNDANESLTVKFWLGAGSNFTSGTLATSWASETAANRAVGCINTTDSTSNNVHITGVQLEIGEYDSTSLPPFQHEGYGDNLARCQRYFQKLTNGESGKGISMIRYWSATAAGGVFNLPTTMRANPSAAYANGTDYWTISGGTGGANDPFDDVTNNDTSLQNAGWYSGSEADGTAGFAGLMMTNSSSAKAEFSAEL